MHLEYTWDSTGFEVDPADINYDNHRITELQETWRAAFDTVYEHLTPYLLDATAKGSVMKTKRSDLRIAILRLISRMARTVNREFKERFMKRPAYYLGRWTHEIHRNTLQLIDAAEALAADCAPWYKRAKLRMIGK